MAENIGQQIIQGLANRILQLEEISEEERDIKHENVSNDVPRFRAVSQKDTDEMIEKQKNKNTVSKTKSDMKLFTTWLACVEGENRLPEEIPAMELNNYLGKFYLSVRKTDGKEYEPDSLSGIQNSIDRYLSEKQYGLRIKTAEEFEHARQVLMAKRKSLKKEGKGNNPNKAQALQTEDLNILYEKGVLGAG